MLQQQRRRRAQQAERSGGNREGWVSVSCAFSRARNCLQLGYLSCMSSAVVGMWLRGFWRSRKLSIWCEYGTRPEDTYVERRSALH